MNNLKIKEGIYKKCEKYILNNKARFFSVFILILIFLAILIWCNNNYYVYNSTIAKVLSVSESYERTEEGPSGREEEYYNQIITAKVKNGQYKGEVITIKNTYSSSLVENEKYKKGDDLFISLKESNNKLTGSISSIKRDKFIVLLIGVFVITIILIAGKFGIYTIVTLIANIAAFIYFIKLYISGKDFILINFLMIVFFSVVTLLFLGGFSRKNISAIISTIVTTYLIYGLYELSVKITGDLHYEFINNISGPNDIESIFLSGVIIGSLGAIMDVSITINSSINELVNTCNSISIRELIKSIREIGYDIMGTMINVLMFSYIGGSLSIIILKIINNYTLSRLIEFDLSFEVIRFLVGSIGIVSAVPISGFIGILLLKKGALKR